MTGRQIFWVKVLAAPMDMIAADTKAPSAIATKQKPANQSRKAHRTSLGYGILRVLNPDTGGERHSAEKGDQPEHEGICGERHRIVSDHTPTEAARVAVSARGYTKRAIADPIDERNVGSNLRWPQGDPGDGDGLRNNFGFVGGLAASNNFPKPPS